MAYMPKIRIRAFEIISGLAKDIPIPVQAAKEIAERYGYDQIIIYARRVGVKPEPNGEHMTTYGRTPTHCAVAAYMGDLLKKHMGWDVFSTVSQLSAQAREQYDLMFGGKKNG